jgi:hypothetical protein
VTATSRHVGPVGFIGLGAIGAPIARHLLEWPGGLVVCDVAPTQSLLRRGGSRGVVVREVTSAAGRVGHGARRRPGERCRRPRRHRGWSRRHGRRSSTIRADTAERSRQSWLRGTVSTPVAAASSAPRGLLAVWSAATRRRSMLPGVRHWSGSSSMGPSARHPGKLARNLLQFVASPPPARRSAWRGRRHQPRRLGRIMALGCHHRRAVVGVPPPDHRPRVRRPALEPCPCRGAGRRTWRWLSSSGDLGVDSPPASFAHDHRPPPPRVRPQRGT